MQDRFSDLWLPGGPLGESSMPTVWRTADGSTMAKGPLRIRNGFYWVDARGPYPEKLNFPGMAIVAIKRATNPDGWSSLKLRPIRGEAFEKLGEAFDGFDAGTRMATAADRIAEDDEVLDEEEDDSWLDQRVKNPKTGNMVLVRSLDPPDQEPYRIAHLKKAKAKKKPNLRVATDDDDTKAKWAQEAAERASQAVEKVSGGDWKVELENGKQVWVHKDGARFPAPKKASFNSLPKHVAAMNAKLAAGGGTQPKSGPSADERPTHHDGDSLWKAIQGDDKAKALVDTIAKENAAWAQHKDSPEGQKAKDAMYDAVAQLRKRFRGSKKAWGDINAKIVASAPAAGSKGGREPDAAEARSIRAWTGAVSSSMRQADQKGTPDEWNDKLNAYLKVAPKYEGPISRGMVVDGAGLEAMKNVYKPGYVWAFDSKQSFTSDDKVASDRMGYLADRMADEGKTNKVKFKVKAKSGVDLSAHSRFPEEKEVVMPKDAKLKVSKAYQEGDTWVVELEEP